MDPELTTLARSASPTLVTLMATDAWERTGNGVVAHWRRAVPESADAVAAPALSQHAPAPEESRIHQAGHDPRTTER